MKLNSDYVQSENNRGGSPFELAVGRFVTFHAARQRGVPSQRHQTRRGRSAARQQNDPCRTPAVETVNHGLPELCLRGAPDARAFAKNAVEPLILPSVGERSPRAGADVARSDAWAACGRGERPLGGGKTDQPHTLARGGAKQPRANLEANDRHAMSMVVVTAVDPGRTAVRGNPLTSRPDPQTRPRGYYVHHEQPLLTSPDSTSKRHRLSKHSHRRITLATSCFPPTRASREARGPPVIRSWLLHALP